MYIHTEDEMDRILAAFHEDRQSSAPRPLSSWILDHPTLRNEFVQWATELPALEIAESRPAYPQFEDRSRAIGQSVLKRIGLDAADRLPLVSINDAARGAGISPRELAERLGIGITLVAKLNRRLVLAATVPLRLVQRLSEELKVSADQITAYLSRDPTLVQSAAYRSDRVPEVAEPESFEAAIRSSRDMTEDQKAEWLR